ncbi:hypothetical protein SAMN05660330_00109 [Desulforhopalus singaporensis]|uniref:Uncharacterized protein n=1 Tax=Desulforhopalus singaporensis TaxID=91360 RepID=A0A1H0J1R4_9BACT|nr:hypothetical protein SAMN05660330_00109 [Desulforhopalus singaporensis]
MKCVLPVFYQGHGTTLILSHIYSNEQHYVKNKLLRCTIHQHLPEPTKHHKKNIKLTRYYIYRETARTSLLLLQCNKAWFWQKHNFKKYFLKFPLQKRKLKPLDTGAQLGSGQVGTFIAHLLRKRVSLAGLRKSEQ